MTQRSCGRSELVGAFRIIFGLIWAVDAFFKWSPAFARNYVSMLVSASRGQPAWLQPWFRAWIHLVSPAPHFWAVLTALVETATALGLLVGFAQKTGYLVGIAFSLLIWSTAEGFGGPYTPGATDIGTSIIYAVAFAYLSGMQYLEGLPAWSVDRWLIRRWLGWARLADFRRHEPVS